MKNEKIKFNAGKLKILQISDLQDKIATSVDTLNFVKNAISSVKPDLIVLTGDQLDVVGMWGKDKKTKQMNVEKAINRLFSALNSFNVPYILTFGNHDCETGVSNELQTEIYKKYKNCICFDDIDDGRPDCGTYNSPILSSDGSHTAMNIYMIDTHSSTDKKYDGLSNEQLEWYKKTSDKLKNENDGKPVPSILFQHIPMPEIYEILKEVPKGTKKALPAYRERKGKYFLLDAESTSDKGHFGEAPATLLNNVAEFDSICEKKDVFAIFFGHDHYNSFVGKVRGIDMGYCPGAGYNTYGLKERGMRVFEFDEKDIKDYKTYIVEYSDVCKKSLAQPVKNLIYSNAPSSVDAVLPFAVKFMVVAACIIVALCLIYIFISKLFVQTLLIASVIGGIIYLTISLIYSEISRKKLLKEMNDMEDYHNE